ncbi:MAG: YidB family protein, partial [Pyrinomonadaceae bacterium]
MALFDSLISEVNERFHLGDKGNALLSALFGLMINKAGGLNGFLEMFRRAGLEQTANSWVSSGANSALSNQQTEDALGTDNLSDITTQAGGLPTATAISALSFLIPTVIDKLTPNGVVPSNNNLTGMIGSYLSGKSGSGGERAGTAGMPDRTDAAGEMLTDTARRNTVTEKDDGSVLRWILPLVLVVLLGFIGYQFCGKPNQNVAMANTNAITAHANSNIAVATAKIDPRLSIRAENGKYSVTGIVSSEAEKNQIMESMRRELGDANTDFSGLKIDQNAKPVSWLAKFAELLPSLRGWASGTLTFEGENRLVAAGNIPQTVIDKIKSLFTGWTLPAFFLGTGADAQKAANEQAAQALKSASTPQQVVDALNLSIINFATGESDVPADA